MTRTSLGVDTGPYGFSGNEKADDLERLKGASTTPNVPKKSKTLLN